MSFAELPYVNVRVVWTDASRSIQWDGAPAELPKTMLLRIPQTIADKLTPGARVELGQNISATVESFYVYPLSASAANGAHP